MTFAEYVADMMMQRAREQEQFPPNPTGIPEQVDMPGFANYLAEQMLSPQGAIPQFAQAAMQPEQWVPKAMDLAGQGANWALYNLTPPGIMLQSSRNIMDRGIPQDISQVGDLVNDLVNMTPPGMLEGLAGKIAMGGVVGMAKKAGSGKLLDDYLRTKTSIHPEGLKGWSAVEDMEPKWHNFGLEKRKDFYDPDAIRESGQIKIWDHDENKWWTFKDKESELKFREKYPFANLTDPADQERTFYRFGEPPTTNRSHNFADQKGELGVSVYATPDGSGGAAFFADRDIYYGKGRQIGWGSDGEPLIIPTGEWKKHKPEVE